MPYMSHVGSDFRFDIKEDRVLISVDWLSKYVKAKGLEVNHAEIYKWENSYWLKSICGETYYNGDKLQESDTVKIEHNAGICFGNKRKGALFIFADPVQSQKWSDTKRIVLDPIQRAKSIAEILSKEFFSACPTNLTDFSRYTVKFILEKFRATRGALYKVDGKIWTPLAAVAPSTSFAPPRMLLDEIWEKGEPVRMRRGDGDSSTYSKSIIRDKVYSAIGYPIHIKKHRAKKLIGVIYIDNINTDSNMRVLGETDSIILGSILPGITSAMNILITADNERVKSDSLFKSLCQNEKLPNTKVKIINKNVYLFGNVRAVKDRELVIILCHVQNKEGVKNPHSSAVIVCSSILTLIESVFESQLNCMGMAKDYLKNVFFPIINSFAQKRFPDFNISVGTVTLRRGGIMSSAGYGKTSLIVKPEQRSSYAVDIIGEALGGSPLIPEANDYVLKSDSLLYITNWESKEASSRILDRVVNFDVASRHFSGGSGGILVHFSKSEEGEEFNELKTIEL